MKKLLILNTGLILLNGYQAQAVTKSPAQTQVRAPAMPQPQQVPAPAQPTIPLAKTQGACRSSGGCWVGYKCRTPAETLKYINEVTVLKDTTTGANIGPSPYADSCSTKCVGGVWLPDIWQCVSRPVAQGHADTKVNNVKGKTEPEKNKLCKSLNFTYTPASKGKPGTCTVPKK